jgi:hypothetical protein
MTGSTLKRHIFQVSVRCAGEASPNKRKKTHRSGFLLVPFDSYCRRILVNANIAIKLAIMIIAHSDSVGTLETVAATVAATGASSKHTTPTIRPTPVLTKSIDVVAAGAALVNEIVPAPKLLEVT